LHIAEGFGEVLGEFLVTHIFDLLDCYGFAVGDLDAVAGGEELFEPGPAFEGAIYNDRDNRGAAAS
jgi:hypothetical protein